MLRQSRLTFFVCEKNIYVFIHSNRSKRKQTKQFHKEKKNKSRKIFLYVSGVYSVVLTSEPSGPMQYLRGHASDKFTTAYLPVVTGKLVVCFRYKKILITNSGNFYADLYLKSFVTSLSWLTNMLQVGNVACDSETADDKAFLIS